MTNLALANIAANNIGGLALVKVGMLLGVRNLRRFRLMSLKYNVIEIFTSEEARWQGRPVWDAIVAHVRRSGTAARCMVTKGLAAATRTARSRVTISRYFHSTCPVKVEVILPAAELDDVLPGIEEIVSDGIVMVEDMEVRLHRTRKRLIPRQIRVKDAMTCSPKTVSEGTPVSEVIRLLLSNEFNAVPVVDPAGHPVGIVTQGDVSSSRHARSTGLAGPV